MLGSIAMESEASHMLEAALEQMDGIIAGSRASATELSSGVYDLGSPVSCGPLQVVQLAEELRLSLDLQPSQGDREGLRCQLPEETARALLDWLQCRDVNLCSPAINESYQERLLRLEGDKESLVLQVSVLTDQVEAQGEKIRDLESALEEHHQKLVSTEEMLQQELLSRTSLEGEKLDLMDEVSQLKLTMVGMEESHDTHQHTRPESPERKQNKAECVVNLISELQEQMCRFQEEISTRIQEKQALERREAQQGATGAGLARAVSPEAGSAGPDLCLSSPDPGNRWVHGGQSVHDLVQEVTQLRNKVEELEDEKSNYERKLRVTKVAIGELQEMLSSKDNEIHSLHNRLMARESTLNNNGGKEEEYIKQLLEKYQEFQKLKRGMESLLASNDEKDRHIEELTTLLGHYRKVKEVAALPQASSEEELSSSHQPRALTHKAHSEILRSEFCSQGFSPFLMSSASCHRELDFGSSMQSPFETFKVTISDASYLNGSWSQNRVLSSSLEELQTGSSKAVEFLPHEPVSSDAVAKNRHMDENQYRTLPGKLSKAAGHRTGHLNGEQERDEERPPSPKQLSHIKSHKDYGLIRCRSASAPALGLAGKHNLYDVGRPESLLEESCLSDQSPLSSGGNSEQHSPVSPENRKSHRGIRKLWGRIRRSQSGSPVQLDEAEQAEFRRGGYRATAGPRLARPGNRRFSHPKAPFHKWTSEQLGDWLEDMGLGQYGVLSRNWLHSGQTLVLATPQELEKEMGLKNPLHRKKLQLAVKMLCSKQVEKSAELDHIWVTRWLDDIGLPQYKDQFNDGRVDGHMLQYLTVNDLLFLKVNSQLHHLSIKCAIHVLRVNQFHPNCLKRRPSNEPTPSEVVQWSNHRVMEWLRSVDLAEYAPNLRGSGVHGGLIILEPRFTSDTLALLLNIPPQKTLLRRHLASNFGSLVGGQAEREKREYMGAAGYTPLSTTAKIRPKKLVFSNLTHLRRRRPGDSTDYICPLDSSLPASMPPASSMASSMAPSMAPSVTSSIASSVSQPAANGSPGPSYAAFRGLRPILDREPGPHAAQQVGPDDS
ncbi:liprin-beta-2b isoform X2 [Gadus morhua]|uniref:liprin-beta-2b isoform X2 n=1 Tax=Gadus morhua TaxID=8049 RepID=UPI0011B7C5FF|nr:liprin-beta-2-like isoform X2 [Gadus morhua]